MLTDITEEEIRVAVGKNAQYYLAHFGVAGKPATGFNWAGFLCGPFWMAYRRMYAYFFALLAFMATSILVELLWDVPEAVSRGLGIGTGMGLGYVGNWLYQLHVHKIVRGARVEQLPQEQYLAALSKRGGTSLPAMFASIGLTLATFATMIVLPVVAELTGLIESEFGKVARFGQNEIFYQPPVTADVVTLVGEYLADVGYFDDDPASVQMLREQGIYQLRFVVDGKSAFDRETQEAFQELGQDIVRELLGGAPAEVHLCNPAFETIRLIRPGAAEKP